MIGAARWFVVVHAILRKEGVASGLFLLDFESQIHELAKVTSIGGNGKQSVDKECPYRKYRVLAPVVVSFGKTGSPSCL